MGELLSIKEVAQLLKISVPSIYRLTSQKRILFIKLGQRVLFDPKDIETWIGARRVLEEQV